MVWLCGIFDNDEKEDCLECAWFELILDGFDESDDSIDEPSGEVL